MCRWLIHRCFDEIATSLSSWGERQPATTKTFPVLSWRIVPSSPNVCQKETGSSTPAVAAGVREQTVGSDGKEFPHIKPN